MHSILPLLISFISLALGTGALRGKRCSENTVFFLLCLTTFFWQGTWSVLFNVQDPVIGTFLAKFGYFFIIFLPTFMYHFLALLSNKFVTEKKFIVMSYVLDIGFVASLIGPLFVEGIYVYSWGSYPNAGIIHPLHVFQTIVVVCRGLYLLWFSTIKEELKESEKQRNKIVLVALFIYLFAAFDYLCNYGVEFYPVGVIFVQTSFLLIFYSILKYELFEFKMVLAKTASLMLVAFFFLLLYASFYFLVESLFLNSKIVIFCMSILYILGVVFLVEPLHKFFHTPIEKKFLKRSFNKERVLANISLKLMSASNRSDILDAIGGEITKEMELKYCKKLVPEFKRGKDGYVLSETGWKQEPGVRIEDEDQQKHINYFKSRKSLLFYSELPEHVQEFFKHLKGQNRYTNKESMIILPQSLFLPIQSVNGFNGMLVFGPKISEEPFTKEDKLILQTIMHQIMVAFDKLAHQEHLGESNKKLAAANNELTEQIELKEKALAVAKDASTYETFANLTKQISHEIRNPMTGIMLTVDAFETKVERAGGTPEPKQLNTFMENIRYMSGRIFNILDTMLRYGKSKTPNKVAVNLKDVMSAVEVLMNLYAKNKSVKIQNNITESIKVKGFQTRLEQVFTNLVKNAVEAFPKGKMDGKVTVSLTPESYTFKNKHIEKGVRIDIADNGKGIEEDKLKNIFDPFITHKSGGTGLGLSVVHDIIDDHEGLITIQSEVDKGTTFSVFLPLEGDKT